MKAKKQSKKKENLSLRRKFFVYYKRFWLILKLLLVSLLCLLIFTDVLKSFTNEIHKFFCVQTAKYGFVIEKIVIAGNKNTELKDIASVIGARQGDPIFSIDIDKVKERLEAHVWIKLAVVERRLPDVISIAVIERTPIAIWQFQNKLYLIDVEGNRIAKYESNFGELLHVVGQDANIYAQNLIDDLNRYPDLSSKVLSAVRHGQRRWDLNLEGKITVKMPEKNFEEAYKYLKFLDKNKKLFDQGNKILDLRDSNKYFLEKH